MMQPEYTIIDHSNVSHKIQLQAKEIKQLRSKVIQHHLTLAIAKKLQQPPELIQYHTGPHGKKTLSTATQKLCQHILKHPLYFSISHSGTLSAFALGSHNIGLDIEDFQSRQNHHPHRLAKKLIACSAPTLRQQTLRWQQFQQSSPQQQRLLTLRLWTLLEAITKIHGDSLWHRFQQGFALTHDTWHTLSTHNNHATLTLTVAQYQAYFYGINQHPTHQLTLTSPYGALSPLVNPCILIDTS